MEKLYIVIPAYNEAENIRQCVKDWYPVVEKIDCNTNTSRLVIINDGSKDDTYKILQSLRSSYP